MCALELYISRVVKEQRTATAEGIKEIDSGEVNPAYSLSGGREKCCWID
jgi:hypothetical protein